MNDNDLRVLKTKKALSQTLSRMLEKQELSTITVNSICENAMVHRTTFYKHFYDKYDLLVYVLREQFQGYFSLDIKQRINHPFQSAFSIVFIDLQTILAKQEKDEAFSKTIADYFLAEFQRDIESNLDKLTLSEDFPPDLLTYIYAANIGAILHWARNTDEPYDWAHLDKLFTAVLPVKINI
ncbi:TetR/AcrR family transcriptional regulator [Listeria booriae]|uniref:TetR/AcrR family transcriptional regulator n=1 Tax=Listeria booriae TaxID=1552123 RepID=A0A841Y516_9LIST|nr:TetR/AcrR family transcriptional regulator [Listeria booriae]MBC1371417.1 TetR/AcrR family transcriptional regulator [Listeria booriae]